MKIIVIMIVAVMVYLTIILTITANYYSKTTAIEPASIFIKLKTFLFHLSHLNHHHPNLFNFSYHDYAKITTLCAISDVTTTVLFILNVFC